MTSIEPIMYEGKEIVPLQFLKAVLPDPASLGPRTVGKTNIGCIFQGKKDGKEKKYYLYNICDHQECYKEVGSQAISYTTGVPAMIGAMVATDGEILGTEGGTGFIGCIIVGYLVGYLVKWMNSWNLAKEFKPMMPIFIIPLTGVAVVSALFIFVLGKPVTLITDLLNSLLVELAKNPSSAVVLGIVLGAMVGIDMGGPINKAAFFFGVTSIAQGNLQIMGIVSTSIAVAPLSMGIAAVVGKDKFTPEEKSAGIYTIFMGIIGISEGAIPFAASDPGHVLPAVVAGSALTGAAAAVCGVTSAVPHGGLVVALFKATNYMSLYFLCVMAGTALSIAIVLAFKRRQEKNR